MVVTSDVGDPTDIHPTRKRPVGERFAAIALARDYGRTDVPCLGPVFKEMTIENNTAVISFDNAENGLMTKDGEPLTWFFIAGKDKKFVEADAIISGNTVIVKSDKVSDPLYVRFGWIDTCETNLYNTEGVPAMPFTTEK